MCSSDLFLELLQELRDLIYTFALVRDTICIIANQESFLGCGHNTITSYSVKYERTLRNLVCSRSTWVTSFDHRDARLPFSYEYLPHADCNLSNLRFFYTKRQIYRESLSIFYSSNLFDSIIGMMPAWPFLRTVIPTLYHRYSISLEISYECVAISDCIDKEIWALLIAFMKLSMILDSLALVLAGWVPDMRKTPWN